MCNGNIAAYGKVISPQLAKDWRGLGATLPMDNSYNATITGKACYIDLMAAVLSIDKAQ